MKNKIAGSNEPDPESLALLEAILKAMDEKKARDVVVFDMRGHSDLTDFCVLATGSSGPHLKALANELRVGLKGFGSAGMRRSGTPESGWIVVDAADVVAHLMTSEMRSYYALDELWAKVARFDPEVAGATSRVKGNCTAKK